MGDAGGGQDGSRGLSLVDPEVHRSPGRVPVRPGGPAAFICAQPGAIMFRYGIGNEARLQGPTRAARPHQQDRWDQLSVMGHAGEQIGQ